MFNKLSSLLLLITVSLAINSQTNTIFPGSWNNINNWDNGVPNANDNVIVSHDMILNQNIAINNNRTYLVEENGSIIDPAGGPSFQIQIGTNGLLDVNGNVQINNNLRSGGLRVREYDTLTVGNAEFISNSTITIDEFGVMIVNGDLDIINNGWFQGINVICNGIIYVNGDIFANSGFLGSVNISGTGKIQATGTVSSNGFPAPSFFGSTNIGCTSGCEYGGGSGLPIELVSFSAAHTESGMVKLNWLTETEINCDYYIVEKSYNGLLFEEIAKVKGAGNTLNSRKYEVVVPSDPKDVYYRLTQFDFDGTSQSFEAIALESSAVFKKSDLLVYPNPVQPSNVLKIYLKEIEPGSFMEIRDINGKLIVGKKLRNNLTEITIDEKFKNGVYILNMFTDNKVTTKKLVISN